MAIRVARKLKAIDVIDVLSDLLILRGVPAQVMVLIFIIRHPTTNTTANLKLTFHLDVMVEELSAIAT